jgi:hypothetical protein
MYQTLFLTDGIPPQSKHNACAAGHMVNDPSKACRNQSLNQEKIAKEHAKENLMKNVGVTGVKIQVAGR